VDNIKNLSRLEEAGAVIFDLDGTLFDKRGLALRLIAANVTDLFRIRAERQVRREMLGMDLGNPEALWDDFFRRLSKHCGEKTSALRDWYFDTYLPRMCRVLQRHYNPRADVAAALSRLVMQNTPIAVFSDYPRTAERMAALGLAECGIRRERFFGPEFFGAFKPAERPFRVMAEILGKEAKDIIVVGDREDTDGEGARKCGMGFILIE
jgi:FMN phosphatase YigB (HAD superfamily)